MEQVLKKEKQIQAKPIMKWAGGKTQMLGDIMPKIPQKYGIMRKKFLKEHRSARYQYLVLTGKLTEHLNQVDKEAREKVEILVEQMAEQWGVTEELKMQDQMEWVRRKNNIQATAEEIAYKNIIFM